MLIKTFVAHTFTFAAKPFIAIKNFWINNAAIITATHKNAGQQFSVNSGASNKALVVHRYNINQF